ncbi:hypothetical protein AB5J62_33425 [Amycolatopsis sp. cg5]
MKEVGPARHTSSPVLTGPPALSGHLDELSHVELLHLAQPRA